MQGILNLFFVNEKYFQNLGNNNTLITNFVLKIYDSLYILAIN